jgi:hypothetical protein
MKTKVSPLWEMKVEIGEHKIRAFIDSGVSVNLISKDIIDKFELKIYKID